MYLIYVDESGDTGLVNSPSQYFILCGLVVHELRWNDTYNRLVTLRSEIRDKYKIKIREEIHSTALVNGSKGMNRIPIEDRMEVFRIFADNLAKFQDISVISVVVNKENKPSDYNVLNKAWTALIQRFENTISNRNFSGPQNSEDKGLIIPDVTNIQVKSIIRKMRVYNPIPYGETYQGYHDSPLLYVVEDPWMRRSEDSLFVQSSDMIVFLLKQFYLSNRYFKRYKLKELFLKLEPILCKVASNKNQLGIVEL